MKRRGDLAVADTVSAICRGLIDDSVWAAPALLSQGRHGSPVTLKRSPDPIEGWSDALGQGGLIVFAPDAERPRCDAGDGIVLRERKIAEVGPLHDLAGRLGADRRLVVAVWPDRALAIGTAPRGSLLVPRRWLAGAHEACYAHARDVRERVRRERKDFVRIALVPARVLVTSPVAGAALRKQLRLDEFDVPVVVYRHQVLIIGKARDAGGIPCAAFPAGSAEARALARLVERDASHLATTKCPPSFAPIHKRSPHG